MSASAADSLTSVKRVYDCYEGTVSADSIQVRMQPDGTAEVRFLVKDAVTIKGVPMRWLMLVEDGQWKVANIFFEKDDDFDILMNMRAYPGDPATTTALEEGKNSFSNDDTLCCSYCTGADNSCGS